MSEISQTQHIVDKPSSGIREIGAVNPSRKAEGQSDGEFLSAPATNRPERGIVRKLMAPDTQGQRDWRDSSAGLDKARSELNGELNAVQASAKKPEGIHMKFGGGNENFPARTDPKTARNYNAVRANLLPQDWRGRVRVAGGVCNDALQELENAAGDPVKWTNADIQKPGVNELIACYQGLDDLRDNRAMHGDQTRALERLAQRQKQIDQKKVQNNISVDEKHMEQVKSLLAAFQNGIGATEFPLGADVTWSKASELPYGAEHASRLLNVWKKGLQRTDTDRWSDRWSISRPSGDNKGNNDGEAKKDKPTAMQIFLELLGELFKSLFKDRDKNNL